MTLTDEERNGFGYGDRNATDKEIIKDLVARIEEAMYYIKDDPKLEKEMDEIPRLNYLLECIESSLDGAFRDFTKPEMKKEMGLDDF